MKTYVPTIGLEIHAELKTNTKMFCACSNDPHASEPNVHVCPICMGHPGTLPVVNNEAVKHVMKVGVALNATVAEYTEFDRKNYFYPDIPKGYQISQYAYPIVSKGSLLGITITRVHLEEDTARSLHDQGDGSIIDYNRAGVPLMELVTEPEIHDAKTAGNFARELQLLLRTLGVSDANMEKGEMRVEANISVSLSHILGTKVEIKNLNSFKSVENAIDFEVLRHIELLERGEKIIQETRGWDEIKGKTFSQRAKETAHDYRYFPDPDIPKFNLSSLAGVTLSRIKEELPILPSEKREKYGNLGLTIEQVDTIIGSNMVDHFFHNVISGTTGDVARLVANYLTTDLMPMLQKDVSILERWNHQNFRELMEIVHNNEITSRVAKDLLLEILTIDDRKPRDIAVERGLLQDSSEDGLLKIVKLLIEEHQSVVADFQSGKDASLQFLVGQGMKLSRGAANPKLLADLLRKVIRENK